MKWKKIVDFFLRCLEDVSLIFEDDKCCYLNLSARRRLKRKFFCSLSKKDAVKSKKKKVRKQKRNVWQYKHDDEICSRVRDDIGHSWKWKQTLQLAWRVELNHVESIELLRLSVRYEIVSFNNSNTHTKWENIPWNCYNWSHRDEKIS